MAKTTKTYGPTFAVELDSRDRTTLDLLLVEFEAKFRKLERSTGMTAIYGHRADEIADLRARINEPFQG